MENRITPRNQNPSADAGPPPLEQADFDKEDGLESASDAPSADNGSHLQLDGDSGGNDIGFDRIVRDNEAGLGGGLDQAEEAQLGVTDEELQEMIEERQEGRRSKPNQ